MDIILISGLWLDASAWDATAERLRDRGHRVTAVSLPGQGAPPSAATLDDQLGAVLDAVDAAGGEVMVVGHSAASALAWIAADALPGSVARVVTVGGFPPADGATYVEDEFAAQGDSLPFPGWERFDDEVVADLDEDRRAAIAAAAIPVPIGVAHATVRLRDERRYGVPVTVICPEFSAEQVREWIAAGELPELSRAADVECIDIDSGHWPMVTRPDELADLLHGLADG